MYSDIDKVDIELLNAYSNLNTSAQKDFKDYIQYLLTKQYKRELMIAIFHNSLLHSLIKSMKQIIENEGFQICLIENRVKQISELYFGIFEKIYYKYSSLVEGLDSSEVVKDFGRNSFDNINRACMSQNRLLIRMEVAEFCDGYYKMAQKKEARKIVAV